MKHLFEVADEIHEVWLSRGASGYELLAEGKSSRAGLTAAADGRFDLLSGEHVAQGVVAADGDDVFIHLNGATYHVRYIDPLIHYARGSSGAAADVATAPMPGTVVSVQVGPGKAVTRGETLLVIESMKLETAITAWRDGVVAELHVTLGASFQRSAPLISLLPEGAA